MEGSVPPGDGSWRPRCHPARWQLRRGRGQSHCKGRAPRKVALGWLHIRFPSRAPSPTGRKISLAIQMRPREMKRCAQQHAGGMPETGSLPAFPLPSHSTSAAGLPQSAIPWAFGKCLNHPFTRAGLIFGLGNTTPPPPPPPQLLYCTFYLGLSIYSHSVLSFPTLVDITPFYLQ